MKLHQEPVYRWYGELSRDRSSLQDEFRKGRPKSVILPETIETILDNSGASIYSILHEHLIVKKISSRWIAHNLSIAHKKSHKKARFD